MLEKSNLCLSSNIYAVRFDWIRGDAEFMSKIWDEKALERLKYDEMKKEIRLTEHQKQLLRCYTQCSQLPSGERPWGFVADDKGNAIEVCFCKKVTCGNFASCRGERGPLSNREIETWNAGVPVGGGYELMPWIHRKRPDSSGGVREPDVKYDPTSTTGGMRPTAGRDFPDDEKFE